MYHSTGKHIADYLQPGRHIHLVGIGGVSMRPLSLVLRSQGMIISGSDMNSSFSTDELISKGIHVFIGHAADNISGADCLIRTAAAHNDNPEIAAAREAGIPVFERAEAWGFIMQKYPNAICVSGTHGKTTTTSMITQIFMEGKKDPTVMIGGTLPIIKASHRIGNGDTIILESCEYCNSFLNFYPTTALILNIEADHLDFFKDLADIQSSFRRFAQLIPEDGVIIANGDDPNVAAALAGMNYLTFGLKSNNTVYGEDYSEDWRSFRVICNGGFYAQIHLSVFGRHNAMNALAACAAAYQAGIPGDVTAKALHAFTGAGRRMEFKGSYHGADIYDDYAHHPGELKALFAAAKTMGYERIICAFQPHTYTRTNALFHDFVRELKAADVTILTDIYAARERNNIGISSRLIAEQIPGSVYCPTLQDVSAHLRKIAQPGDMILTVGAGDIYKAGDAVLVKD